MNLQFHLKKLKNSEEYKRFVRENPDAYFCSGFFSIDKIGNDNKRHFDFYVPLEKRIFSFQLEEGFKIVPLENLSGQVLDELDDNIDFGFEEVEKMIREKMREEGVDKEIQKILFSLQKLNERNFLVGTVFISSLGLIKINIDLEDRKVTDFEKKSFFDILKKV